MKILTPDEYAEALSLFNRAQQHVVKAEDFEGSLSRLLHISEKDDEDIVTEFVWDTPEGTFDELLDRLKIEVSE